jgi:putative membrane protein
MLISQDTKDAQLRLAIDRTRLANERTYAAWLRTGLAVAAGGIAVAHLVPEPSRDSLIALGLGAGFVLLGVGTLVYGAHQFAAMSRDLAVERPGRGRVAGRAAYALTALIGLLLLAVLVFLWSHQGRPRTPPASLTVGETPSLPP